MVVTRSIAELAQACDNVLYHAQFREAGKGHPEE